MPSQEDFQGAFPEEKKLLVKHVILAHHGQYEYGSPKRPKCIEALMVHMIDDLGFEGERHPDVHPTRSNAGTMDGIESPL